MKRMSIGLVLLAATSVGFAQAPAADQGVILKAMKDEMARGRQLRLVGEPPYFIEYSLDDTELYQVSATYGSLIQENATRLRSPRVRIRVGDPKLDNSNHLYSDMFRGTRFDSGQFSLDDNYEALRLEFWLATDRVYKQALEALARKKASLKNINGADQLPDMGPAAPVSLILPIPRRAVNADVLRSRVKEVSAIFGSFPQVLNSDVVAGSTFSTSYLVNNEGTEFKIPDNLATFRIRASGLAPDGTIVRDFAQYAALDAQQIPSAEALKAAATQVAENIDLLSKAGTLENYAGPMLFEGMAGPQLLAQLLSRNLTIIRRPVSDPDRPINLPAGELEGRIGARIMPESFDAVDDPTQKEWRGTPLLGSYVIDSEGVVPKPLPMVEKGVLKAYYSTRQPVQGAPLTNAHARLPGGLGNNTALPGNLFIRSSQPVSAAELKKKLLDTVKQRNLPFGIIVRKLDFPSTLTLEELRRYAGQQQLRPVSRPILVYKVTPDGKEELLRGVRFRSLTARSLKDIAAASDESFVFQYLENQAPFAHQDAGGYVSGTSIIGPALLIDDLELEKIPGEKPNPPLVQPPSLTQ